jgi:hypothetical protein
MLDFDQTYNKSDCELVGYSSDTAGSNETHSILANALREFGARVAPAPRPPQAEEDLSSKSIRQASPARPLGPSPSTPVVPKSPRPPSFERYSMEQLRETWSKCVAALSDPTKHQKKDHAIELILLIEKEWDRRGRFAWPSTEASRRNGQNGAYFEYARGMLSYLGYRVGTEARSDSERQAILNRVFEGRLPWLNDRAYMMSWGEPASPQRLKKMADSLASFCKNAKNEGKNWKRTAIRHWETDLGYLYGRYYRGKFGFAWPTTEP